MAGYGWQATIWVYNLKYFGDNLQWTVSDPAVTQKLPE